MKRFLLCSVAAAGLALASPAFADTYEADNVSVLNGINVTIDTPKFENVQSGMIQFTGPNGSQTSGVSTFRRHSFALHLHLSTYHPGDSVAGMAVLRPHKSSRLRR